MNIDQQLDRITYYIFYIPFNILSFILAIPAVLLYFPITYFTNYNEFILLSSFQNILLLYFIFYKFIFEALIELIN